MHRVVEVPPSCCHARRTKTEGFKWTYTELKSTIRQLLTVTTNAALLIAAAKLKLGLFSIIPLYLTLYFWRWELLSKCRSRLNRSIIYTALLSVMVLFLYISLWDGLERRNLEAIRFWILAPVAVFTVPTLGFLRDLSSGNIPVFVTFGRRAALEILVLIPTWVVVLAVLELSIGTLEL